MEKHWSFKTKGNQAFLQVLGERWTWPTKGSSSYPNRWPFTASITQDQFTTFIVFWGHLSSDPGTNYHSPRKPLYSEQADFGAVPLHIWSEVGIHQNGPRPFCHHPKLPGIILTRLLVISPGYLQVCSVLQPQIQPLSTAFCPPSPSRKAQRSGAFSSWRRQRERLQPW